MGSIRQWLGRAADQLAAMSWPMRVSAALLAMLILGGLTVAWLGGGADEDMVVVASGLGDDQAQQAVATLREAAIDCRSQGSSVLVAAEQAPAARAVLLGEARGEDASASFDTFSSQGHMWLSQAEIDKRWRATVMAELGRRVGSFEAVKNASVIYEPAGPRRFGSPSVEATAAVSVTLQPGCLMTPELVDAIADQVCGGISGLERRNVRIIDSAGASYRAGDEHTPRSPSLAAQLERTRAAEAHFVSKINAALSFAQPLVAVVHVEAQEGSPRCTGASVRLPRSYLDRLARAGAGQDDLLAQRQLDTARQAVTKALGLDDAQAVSVDWYFDMTAEATPPTAQASAGPSVLTWVAGSAGATLAGLWALSLLARRRQRKLRHKALLDDAPPAPADDEGAAVKGEFSIDAAELAARLGGEHPQAIALALSQVAPASAAAVLGMLDPALQVDVVRRLAVLGQTDQHVLDEVRLQLAQPATAALPSGAAAVSGIVEKLDAGAQQRLIEALGETEPALARVVGQRGADLRELLGSGEWALRSAAGELEPRQIAIALMTAEQAVRKHVLSALPGWMAKAVRREAGQLGPVRLAEAELLAQRLVRSAMRASGRYEPAGRPMAAQRSVTWPE